MMTLRNSYTVLKMQNVKASIFCFGLFPWTWVLLGISAMVITGFLKGQWFQVYAILMRQECTILHGTRKLLMIFILATIIFTYGYEGIISSLLTVKPPLIIYPTLKTLVDLGYKILRSDIDPGEKLIRIFEMENITQDVQSSVKIFNTKDKYELALEFSKCNVCGEFRSEAVALWILHMNNHFPNISCYCVTKTTDTDQIIYSFLGLLHETMFKIAEIFIESGILGLYNTNFNYLTNLETMREKELKAYNEARAKAFDMTDWKIMSIFLGWAALLGISLLVLMVEQVVVWKSLVRFHTNTKLLRPISCFLASYDPVSRRFQVSCGTGSESKL